MNQSTQATFNATEDTEVEEANLSSSEEKKAIELNNSNNNNSESDNDSGSSGNDSSKNNSTPCFVLFESLICLYGGWKLRKR
jgi:DNA-binding beta-propeller fold protein YncE